MEHHCVEEAEGGALVARERIAISASGSKLIQSLIRVGSFTALLWSIHPRLNSGTVPTPKGAGVTWRTTKKLSLLRESGDVLSGSGHESSC